MPRLMFATLSWHVRQIVRQEAFVADVRSLLGLDVQNVQKAVENLEALPGFIGPKGVLCVLEPLVGKEPARVLADFIHNLGRMRRESGASASEVAEAVAEELNKVSPQSKEANKTVLKDKIELLAKPLPPVERQAKADNLAEATGSKALQFFLVCDFRPVFDESRSCVEGLLPIATLRITKGPENPFGDEDAVEVVLTPEQVGELSELATKAQRKLVTMRELAQKLEPSGVRLPEAWGK